MNRDTDMTKPLRMSLGAFRLSFHTCAENLINPEPFSGNGYQQRLGLKTNSPRKPTLFRWMRPSRTMQPRPLMRATERDGPGRRGTGRCGTTKAAPPTCRGCRSFFYAGGGHSLIIRPVRVGGVVECPKRTPRRGKHTAVRRCTDLVNKHMFKDEPKGQPLFEQAARMP